MNDRKEGMHSALHGIRGDLENADRIITEIDGFFHHLNARIEDWKFSVEEFPDGTRIYARFQVVLGK